MSAKKYSDTDIPKGSLLSVMEYTIESVKELSSPNAIVGEAVERDGVTVIPISRVSVGFAGGGADVRNESKRKSQNPAGAGAKVELSPVSFLVISDKEVKTMGLSAPSAAKSSFAYSLVDAVAGKVKGIIDSKKKK